MVNEVKISSLHVYPIKSCAGIDLSVAEMGTRGFQFDRNWMVVTPDGKQITQRDNSTLALIKTEWSDSILTLNFVNQKSLPIELYENPTTRLAVDIWGHKCIGLDEGERVAQWLSKVLSQDVRLVRFDPEHLRFVDATWVGETKAHTGFADVLPYLITAKPSLADLNELRLRQKLEPSSMNRFRPNIVIDGTEPYEEDSIPALSIPQTDAKLELVRPCSRCVITNIDQSTAEKEKFGNLQLLGKTRNLENYTGKKGAMFGVQAIATNADGIKLRIGDTLYPAPLSAGLPPLPRVF